MTDEDRIANLFGAPDDRGRIAKVEEVIGGPGRGPETTLQFDPDDELAKSSPAAAMTRDMMNSGEDPMEFLQRRGIPYNYERHGDKDELPNPDPAFPNRPQHPNFYALSEAVRDNDAYVQERGMTIREVLDEARFDFDSLRYMANQRAVMLVKGLDMKESDTSEQALANLAAIWIDAFLAGLKVGDRRSTPLPGDIVLDEFTDTQHRGNRL